MGIDANALNDLEKSTAPRKTQFLQIFVFFCVRGARPLTIGFHKQCCADEIPRSCARFRRQSNPHNAARARETNSMRRWTSPGFVD
jgi:hypothetical protein